MRITMAFLPFSRCLLLLSAALLFGCADENTGASNDVGTPSDSASPTAEDTQAQLDGTTEDSAQVSDSEQPPPDDTNENPRSDTAEQGDSQTPEDINLATCVTPTACNGERVEITTTAIWDGSDYSADYRCVLELLRSAAAGELPPSTLALSAGAFSDSPTKYNVALGYAEPVVGLQAYYSPNGGEPSSDPTARCTLATPETYENCLEKPDLDCIGKDALFPTCVSSPMACP